MKIRFTYRSYLVLFLLFFSACETTLNKDNIAMSSNATIQDETSEDSSKNEIVDKAYLEKLKKEGNTLAYLAGISLESSFELISTTENISFDSIDIDEFETHLEKINTAYIEITSYIRENKETIKLSKRIDYKNFTTKLNNFIDASNELRKRKKDNRKFTKDERRKLNTSKAWMVKGSSKKISKKYKVLLDYYNMLIR